MKFIKAIIDVSTAKEAKLFEPSKIASINPDTGVIIQKPAAFHVIKDCATLAHEYLPLYLFEKLENPFELLKGKITKDDLREFVSASNESVFYKHLLIVVLHKAQKNAPVKNSSAAINIKILTNSSSDFDPYGEYGLENTSDQNLEKTQIDDPLTILCEAFNV